MELNIESENNFPKRKSQSVWLSPTVLTGSYTVMWMNLNDRILWSFFSQVAFANFWGVSGITEKTLKLKYVVLCFPLLLVYLQNPCCYFAKSHRSSQYVSTLFEQHKWFTSNDLSQLKAGWNVLYLIYLYKNSACLREIFLLDVSEKLQIKLNNSNQASGQILNLLHETQFEIKLFI